MRSERFTFVVNDDERRMIEKLSERLARTQSDALRFLVREATRQLESDQRDENTGVQHASTNR